MYRNFAVEIRYTGWGEAKNDCNFRCIRTRLAACWSGCVRCAVEVGIMLEWLRLRLATGEALWVMTALGAMAGISAGLVIVAFRLLIDWGSCG